MKIKSG